MSVVTVGVMGLQGVDQIGQSQIIAPSGETVAIATTLADELIVARCDLGLCRS